MPRPGLAPGYLRPEVARTTMPTKGSRMITPMIAPTMPPRSNTSSSPIPIHTVKIR